MDAEVLMETKRLVIRMFGKDDFEALAQILGDSEVMEYSLGGAMDRAEALDYFEKRFLGQYEYCGFGFWALIDRINGSLVGFAGLIIQEIDDKEEVELAYRIARRYWGQGLATEAAVAIRDYAFQELGLERLISIIEPRNVRSIRVAEKVGMRLAFQDTFHGFDVNIYECAMKRQY